MPESPANGPRSGPEFQFDDLVASVGKTVGQNGRAAVINARVGYLTGPDRTPGRGSVDALVERLDNATRSSSVDGLLDDPSPIDDAFEEWWRGGVADGAGDAQGDAVLDAEDFHQWRRNVPARDDGPAAPYEVDLNDAYGRIRAEVGGEKANGLVRRSRNRLGGEAYAMGIRRAQETFGADDYSSLRVRAGVELGGMSLSDLDRDPGPYDNVIDFSGGLAGCGVRDLAPHPENAGCLRWWRYWLAGGVVMVAVVAGVLVFTAGDAGEDSDAVGGDGLTHSPERTEITMQLSINGEDLTVIGDRFGNGPIGVVFGPPNGGDRMSWRSFIDAEINPSMFTTISPDFPGLDGSGTEIERGEAIYRAGVDELVGHGVDPLNISLVGVSYTGPLAADIANSDGLGGALVFSPFGPTTSPSFDRPGWSSGRWAIPKPPTSVRSWTLGPRSTTTAPMPTASNCSTPTS